MLLMLQSTRSASLKSNSCFVFRGFEAIRLGILLLLVFILGFLVDADGLATWLALRPLVSPLSQSKVAPVNGNSYVGAGIVLIKLRKVWHVSLSPLLPRVAGQQT